MLGAPTPVSVWCSWKRRTSSAVAVSGERPMKDKNVLTCLETNTCLINSMCLSCRQHQPWADRWGGRCWDYHCPLPRFDAVALLAHSVYYCQVNPKEN
jgi:hypothetical protein